AVDGVALRLSLVVDVAGPGIEQPVARYDRLGARGGVAHDDVDQPRLVVELRQEGRGDVDVTRRRVAVEAAQRELVTGAAPLSFLGQIQFARDIVNRPVAAGDAIAAHEIIRRYPPAA